VKAFALILLLLVCGSGSAQTVTTIFDAPGSVNTEPAAINRAGQVAGWYMDTNYVQHGFLREPNGEMIVFDAPGAVSTVPTAIDSSGQIIGEASPIPGPQGYGEVAGWRGFVRHPNGTFTMFDAPKSSNTFPATINAAGQITGFYYTTDYPTDQTGHAFLRETDGTFVTFNVSGSNTTARAINSSGQIVGTYVAGGLIHGFMRKANGKITPLDVPDSNTIPTVIRGERIAGFYYTSFGGAVHGFLRKGNRLLTIDATNAISTYVNAMNRGGDVVGYYIDVNYVNRGFLWDDEGKMTTFDALPDANSYTIPRAINSAGQIVGECYATQGSVIHGFLREKITRQHEHDQPEVR
jgi:uncharacterized membrane protein